MIDANDYVNVMDLIEDFEGALEAKIITMDSYEPEQFRLDERSSYSSKIYVDEYFSMMIVSKRDDRALQYYGGFEYVNKEYRQEAGSYVIYHSDDERVQEHLDYLEKSLRKAKIAG
jgi:hypothetical protein